MGINQVHFDILVYKNKIDPMGLNYLELIKSAMITNKCPAGALRRDSPENQTQEVLERRERARSLQSRPGHGNISHEWSTWSTQVQASDDEFCLGRAEQAWVSCCSTCSVPISSGNRIASRLLDSMGSFTVFFMHACDPACRHVFFYTQMCNLTLTIYTP